MRKPSFKRLLAKAAIACALVSPAYAQTEYRQKISNDMTYCTAETGPAIRVTVVGIKAGGGKLRVQSYNGVKADWLKKGRWLSRIETTAQAGSMTFCLPVASDGRYAIAVRHDINENNETDLFEDGGAMSNDPSINIWNFGKPSYKKTAFPVGADVKSITVHMKYW